MSTRILSPRECVGKAIGQMILDFRYWLVPETRILSRWKSQEKCYAVAEGRMVNDFNAMLESLRKSGESQLPMLLVAIQQINNLPDLDKVVGVPFELKTVLAADPEQRHVILRTEPRSYHVQFAFLANDTDSPNTFTSQFCSYIKLIEKRRILVDYFLSPDLTDQWHLTIFENTLYPDKAEIEEKNLTAGLLEFDLAGLTPQVLSGLPPLYPEEFGEGSNLGGDCNNPNLNGGKSPNAQAWEIAREADFYKTRDEPTFKRVKADEKTGIRTEEIIEK